MNNLRVAGGGGVIRNQNGDWIKGSSISIDFATSVTAELWALRDGVRMCIELQLPIVVVEMDALLMVNMISGVLAYSYRLSPLVDDCRAWLSKIPHTRVQHCYSKANAMIDAFTRHGATMEDDLVALNSPPNYVLMLLY